MSADPYARPCCCDWDVLRVLDDKAIDEHTPCQGIYPRTPKQIKRAGKKERKRIRAETKQLKKLEIGKAKMDKKQAEAMMKQQQQMQGMGRGMGRGGQPPGYRGAGGGRPGGGRGGW
jgi:hypothetical protein